MARSDKTLYNEYISKYNNIINRYNKVLTRLLIKEDDISKDRLLELNTIIENTIKSVFQENYEFRTDECIRRLTKKNIKIKPGLFEIILRSIGQECSKVILEGVKLELPYYLGNLDIKVIKVKHSNFNIDWGKTMIYKQELIDKGENVRVNVYDETGVKVGVTEGKDYQFKFTDDFRPVFCWNYNPKIIHNLTVFVFKPTNTRGKIYSEELQRPYHAQELVDLLSKEEVMYSQMGNVQKMYTLIRQDSNYIKTFKYE